MSLRVTHVITGLETGGAEVLLARLIENLDPVRVESCVVSLTSRGRLADRIEAAGARVEALGLPATPGPQSLWKLRQALAATRPEVVQSWLLHSNVLSALLSPTLRGAALVWGVHMSAAETGTHGRTTIALQRAEKELSKAAPQAIIACSETARREMLERGYSSARINLVPNGFDTDAFKPSPVDRAAVREELGLRDETPVVGHFARFHPMKDHANMIAAAKGVLERSPDTVFLLCGNGVDQHNAEIAGLIGTLGDSIRALGERPDVPRILRALDLAALSSATGEALPLVIGEAMASEVPFVATSVGDARDIIGDTGRVVAPRDPAALGDAILELLALPPTERAALGEAARARIISHYELTTMTEDYVSIWERVARTSGSA